jgi:hypothetical protein
MNAKQYKEWYMRHAKDLQEIKKLNSYQNLVEVSTYSMQGHEAEIWNYELDELIIEILGTINDYCNTETGYHSTPHKKCIMRHF